MSPQKLMSTIKYNLPKIQIGQGPGYKKCIGLYTKITGLWTASAPPVVVVQLSGLFVSCFVLSSTVKP